MMRVAPFVVSAWMVAVVSPGLASVVTNSGVSFSNGTFFPDANYAIGVAQSPGATVSDTSTYFRLTRVGTSANSLLQAVAHNLDEGSDWYVVPEGAEFTPANIAAGMFRPLVVGDTFSPAYTLTGLQTFYLGFDTGLSPGPTRGEVLGWLKIGHSAPNLTLLGSAVAYGEPGIVVGGTTVVPEPSAVAAIGCAVYTLTRRRRAKP